MTSIINVLGFIVLRFSYPLLFLSNNLIDGKLSFITLVTYLAFTAFEVSLLILCFNLLKRRIMRSFFEENRNEIQEEFREAAKRLAPNQILLGDKTGVFENREQANVREFLAKSRTELDIFTPNLRYFMMDNRGEIFKEAISRGCKIRLLALHPKHVFISERFAQIDLRNPRQFVSEMSASLKVFLRDYVKPGQVELRVFDEPPTTLVLRSDNEVMVSFILRQGRARKFLHLRMECGKGRAGEPFVIHFDTAFDEAEDVTPELLEEINADIRNRY